MLQYHIDFPKKKVIQRISEDIHVAGWCFDDDSGMPADRVFGRVGSREIDFDLVERPDVITHLGQNINKRKTKQKKSDKHRIGFEKFFKTGNGIKRLRIFAQFGKTAQELGQFLFYFNKNSNGKNAVYEVGEMANYAPWISLHDNLKDSDLEAIRHESKKLSVKPLISIILPVYNTPDNYLREAVESVIDQAYENWELCIADDASTKTHVRQLLEEYQKRDSRVIVVYRETNGHISEASNSAISIANGDWFALLDHDDLLRPHSLYEVAKAINLYPQVKFIYSDEDKIDENGERNSPYFKPDWDPDLLLGQNYLCHLSVISSEIVKKLGGFRKGLEGSQDHDLFLRVTEKLSPSEIIHIPKILYHWRTIKGSTALDQGEKDYTVDSARIALQDHLVRSSIKADLIEVDGGHWGVKYHLPESPPKISLIIPTRDKVKILQKCVDSILEKTDYPNYEIIIIDNGSNEAETLSYFTSLPEDKVQVLKYNHPFNYSAINNFAVKHVDGEIIGLLNNDLEVINSDWLREMVSHANRPEIGCVGAKLYYPNDTIQHAGVTVGFGGVAGHREKMAPRSSCGYFYHLMLTRSYSAVTAACLLVRKSTFSLVGGLDEENLKVAFNDVDFCLKVREEGYRNIFTPFAELYHHESLSRGYEVTPEKQERFKSEVLFMQSKWGETLKTDPYHNRNLSYDTERIAFGFPPRQA
mgnify:CR=1 FL=1